MEIKKKICSGCNELTFIWKSQGKEKYCKQCWYSISPPKSIPVKSEKRKGLDKEYHILRQKFLLEHPMCEAKVSLYCTKVATDIHHLYSGSARGLHQNDVITWKSVCRMCHTEIHDKLSSEELKELGLKL